ncbi:CAP domain-containing protein [Spirochaeta africana]|uniref:Uncharacterized protein with SCP/PR1 domains n=1 Tax=Spirochaeta africana (strain ATCC 700263 / DSM 8902 / Z-7692) TaxID=889378 RepID=H9UHI8_SPIAZ|nr:CAP domain-containing protein [Spirochaeta africana]AFG36981.1 uncharacterized protein with SCP/PR1 domains [Spirochaeta africana DSM 8902]
MKYVTCVVLCAAIAGLSGCATLQETLEQLFAPEAPAPTEPGQADLPPARESTPITVRDNGPFRGELASVEEKILEIVNAERATQGLPALIPSTALAVVARDHSTDMGQRSFYSHVDPDGVTPNDRITAALGDRYYLSGTSENIAYTESSRGFTYEEYTAIANQLMTGWMNSPGHRANILRPDSTHIGIGLHRSGNRIYATQKFMNYIVAKDHTHDSINLSQDTPALRFALNPGRELSRSRLVVRISLPDPSTRWETPGGRFYTGMMFAQPTWIDDTTFEITLPVEYGPGTYRVHFGDRGGNRTNTTAFPYRVVRQ